jgi:hypothetical protein
MQLAVDTRSDSSYVFGKECSTCTNKNKYEKHPNVTSVPGLPVKRYRDVSILRDGYTINETICIRDNEGVGQVNFPCSENRSLSVITDWYGENHENIDGILGLGRISTSLK